MADSDDDFLTEPKQKMRIVYVFAVIAIATFLLGASVTAFSAAIR